MAYFDHGIPGAITLRPLSALRGIVDTPFDARARAIRSRVAELRTLSDAELKDRGLSREDILRHALLTTRR